jgi:thiol-disulfide isomerase/thioredoxin
MKPILKKFLRVFLITLVLSAPVYTPPTWATQAPSFTALNLKEGGKIQFSTKELTEPVLIFFWKSDSKICQRKIPILHNLLRNYPNDFRILGVNVDQDLAKAQLYVKTHKIPFPNAGDPKRVLIKSFGLNAVPKFVLVDTQGRIRYSGHDVPKMKAALAKAIDDSPLFGVSTYGEPETGSTGSAKRFSPSKHQTHADAQDTPAFTGENMNGGTIHFDPQRLSKPTLLVFWATWCGPCLQEIPDLLELHQKNKSRLEILAINTDEDKEKARQFIRAQEITYTNVSDSQSIILRKYELTGIPALFLFNKEGKLLYEGSQMGRKFKKALKELQI